MTEVEELIVRAKPEGVSETTQELEGMEAQTEDSAEAMEDSADEMQGFARRFEGAMGAVIAGLAVASAGLLSQVPVIGEAMSGLFAILEAVAFQVDGVLRPALSPLSDLFFDISNAIFEMEGPAGTLIGLLGTLAGLFFGILVPLGKLTGLFSALGGAKAALALAAKGVVTVLGAIAAALGAPIALVGALVAAIVLLAAAFITDWKGIRTKTVEAIKTIIGWIRDLGKWIRDDLPGLVKDGFNAFIDFVTDTAPGLLSVGVEKVIDTIRGIGTWVQDNLPPMISTAFSALRDFLTSSAPQRLRSGLRRVREFIMDNLPSIDDMKSLGRRIIEALADGIRAAAGTVKDAASDVAEAFRNQWPGSDAKEGPLSDFTDIPDTMATTLASVSDQPQLRRAGQEVASSLDPRGNGSAEFATQPDVTNVIEVDGQILGRTTSRRQRDITASRNIDG